MDAVPEINAPKPDRGLVLPVVGSEPVERIDAARNRLKILAAAERLFEERGSEHVSMDAVAEAAGVGKGTLYRRFGDRCGLARAILDERAREFQESLIRGEPPLGPGAPARARLIAFGEGLLEMLSRHGDVILAAETGTIGARFQGQIYASYRAHVRVLLQELNPELDCDYFADVILGALSAELINFWRSDGAVSDDRVLDGFNALICRLAD